MFVSSKKMKQMVLQESDLKLKEELQQNGYAHFKHGSFILSGLLDSLGTVIQTTAIKENPQSTRLLSSCMSMGFHTDHFAARYIVWFCNSQSSVGGESILLDTLPVLQSLSHNCIRLLQQISVQTHKVFHGDKLSLPLLGPNSQDVYYAPWLVNPTATTQHHGALLSFQSALESKVPIELLLSEGDVLIIDNHRILHGRKSFASDSGRWLTRYWLK